MPLVVRNDMLETTMGRTETANATLEAKVKQLEEKFSTREGEQLPHKKYKTEDILISSTYCGRFLNGSCRYQSRPDKCNRLHRTRKQIADETAASEESLQKAR
jgi:hypothetical protein